MSDCSASFQHFSARSGIACQLALLLMLAGCVTEGDALPPEGEPPIDEPDRHENTAENYPIDICGQDVAIGQAKKEPEYQVACSEGLTRIMAKHSPLFSAVEHTSVITAEATSSAGGIASIQIFAIRGSMTDCTELGFEASLVPCRSDAEILPYQECKYANEMAPDPCQMTIADVDGEMITYYAVAITGTGVEQTTSAITYSGGRPAIELAMPVWWHTDVPTRTLSSGQINLALYMDADFSGNLTEFGNDVTRVLDGVFFMPYPGFAEKYTQYRHYFDIWAFPFPGATADSVKCKHKFESNAEKLDGLVRGSAILHDSYWTDCSSIGEGGMGSVDVSKYAAKSDWLLVHESGHFLLGLADEYGAGGQTPASVPPNVFYSPDECHSAAPLVGAVATNCQTFGYDKETFRIETNMPETMAEESYVSEFFNSSGAAITNRINSCNGGSCYVTPR